MSKQQSIESARLAIRMALVDAVGEDLSWIGPIPQDSWAMAPDALRFVSLLVQLLRPRHVVEFGSGLSTRVLARACATSRCSSAITSIDHDPEFGRAAANELRIPRQDLRLAFQVAPLVLREFGDSPLPAYAFRRSRFASRRPADLILVDGPPAIMGGREGVLYQAVSLSRAGSIILLDDASREQERAALDRLQCFLGDAVQVELLSGFQRGLAAVYVTEPVSCTDVGSYRLRLLSAELESVYRGGCVILIDDDQLRGQLSLGYPVFPFLEKDGEYFGPASDDATAISELERLQLAGAKLLVITWPSFWWLEHYSAFRKYLEANFHCLLRNRRLIAFELTSLGQNGQFPPAQEAYAIGQQK